MKKKQAELLKQFQLQQKAFASSLNESGNENFDDNINNDFKDEIMMDSRDRIQNFSQQQQQQQKQTQQTQTTSTNVNDFDQITCILCQESVKNVEINPIAAVSYLILANKPQVRKNEKKKHH